MLPIKLYTRRKIFRYYTGLSFFIFIWICRIEKDEKRLVRHEQIHFWQQVEMLFIFHWLFYAFFYIVLRSKGHGHYTAYRYNPFEIEAYEHEPELTYLSKRKPFAWVSYIKPYLRTLTQSPLEVRNSKQTQDEWNRFRRGE